MISILAVCFGLILFVSADAEMTRYKVIKGKRAPNFEMINITQSRSLTECSVKCASTEGCIAANWLTTGCELFPIPEGDFNLLDDENASFLCKYFFGSNLRTLNGSSRIYDAQINILPK